MAKRRLYGMSLVLGLALSATVGWAADCGDTTGPGATRAPCSCGDVVTTTTKLKKTDPVVSTDPSDTCSGDGLVIGGDVITLDCAKLALRGEDTGVGVVVSGTDGVTVKRCTLSGFDTGIGIADSTEYTVKNNTVQDNGDGIIAESGPASGGDFGVIGNNTVEASDVGIGLVDTSSTTVKKNKVSNTGGGILIFGDNVSQANVLTDNQVEDTEVGIAVGFRTHNNTITNNRVKHSFIGVLLGLFGPDASDNNVVAGNRADQNGVGIAVLTNNNLVDANLGANNAGDGLAVVDGTGNSVSNNVFNTNGGHGVCAEPGNLDAGGNAGHGNLTPPDVTFAGGCVGP